MSHDQRARSRAWIAGDRVMVRNLRPGPDWVTGTIVEVFGPVTYIVETEDGSRWKRHADQLKDWLLSCSPALSEDVPESLSNEPDDPQVVTPDSPNGVDAEPEPHVDARAEETEPSPVVPEEPRYPRRVRQPPRYYSATEVHIIDLTSN